MNRNIYAQIPCSSHSLNRTVYGTRSCPSLTPHRRQLLLASHKFLPDIFRRLFLEARVIPKVSIALVIGDLSVTLDSGRNCRGGYSRRVVLVLRASLTPLITSGAYIFFAHGCRQFREEVIMLPFIQKVGSLRFVYLPVKHDAVATQTQIHHYPIF